MNNYNELSTLTELIDTHFDELSEYYSKINNSNPDNFRSKIFLPIRNDSTLNNEKYYREFIEDGNKLTIEKVNTIISISCAYGVNALKMKDKGSYLASAFFLNDARYWSGVIFSIITFENMINPFIKEIQSETAGKGGTARGEKSWGKTKQEAQRLARLEKSNYDRLPTMLEATKSIKDAVMNFHRELINNQKEFKKSESPILSIQNPQRTIRGWLQDLDDGETFFKDWTSRKNIKTTK